MAQETTADAIASIEGELAQVEAELKAEAAPAAPAAEAPSVPTEAPAASEPATAPEPAPEAPKADVPTADIVARLADPAAPADFEDRADSVGNVFRVYKDGTVELQPRPSSIR